MFSRLTSNIGDTCFNLCYQLPPLLSEDVHAYHKSPNYYMSAAEMQDYAASDALYALNDDERDETPHPFMLHPYSVVRQRWDLLLLILIFYNALTLPVTLAFDISPEGALEVSV